MLKLLISVALLLSSLAHAKVIEDEQTWLNVNSFISLKSDWQLYLEVQPRFVDYHRQEGTMFYRGALGRTLGKGFSAWLGYGFIERVFPTYLHEDRPFAQLIHATNATSSLRIINRTRFEGRYFRKVQQPSYRFRHLLRAQFRFTGTQWGLVAYDEWFWNANNVNAARGFREGFDQNRAFLGVSYYLGEKDQHLVELGYMNQYVNRKTADASNHILATQVTLRF